MRLIKALGPAAVAAVIAVVSVGVTTASALDTITICKTLVKRTELCPPGNAFGAGAAILTVATDWKLLLSIGTVECPESRMTSKTEAESGVTLPLTITELTSGPAGKCSMCPTIHTAVPSKGKVEVNAEDDFFLNTSVSITLLNCFGFGLTCVYGGAEIKSLFDTDPAVGLGLVLIKSTVTKQPGSSMLCPSEGTWESCYTIVGIHFAGVNLNGWVALYKKA